MTSLAKHMLKGDALRMEQLFKHASCYPTTQFEDFNHVNADATDETKIVTTKIVLGFCHGQLQFCLLVRIGPLSLNTALGDHTAAAKKKKKKKKKKRDIKHDCVMSNSKNETFTVCLQLSVQ